MQIRLTDYRDALELVALGLAVVAGIYGHAKALVRLNGLGRRVRVVEEEQTKINEKMHVMEREQHRSIDDRLHLNTSVARATKSAEDATDIMDHAKAEIVGAINDMRIDVTNKMAELRERVKALEVEMHIRNTQTRGGQ